jgi:hypothetical protein
MTKVSILEENPMSNRKSLLALAAVASLASAALVSTGASAHILYPIGPHYPHLHWYPHGYPHGWYPHGYCWHWHACGPHFGVGVGVGVASSTVVSGGTSVPVATPAPAVAPAPSCLSKRELADGDALFRDRCTGEHAESQPPGGSPAGH